MRTTRCIASSNQWLAVIALGWRPSRFMCIVTAPASARTELRGRVRQPGVVRTIYDPTAGTGGMLTAAADYLAEHSVGAAPVMFGQELNDESYAICKADMLIKGQLVANIVPGNTLSDDGFAHRKFDYMLSNPPFGVEWKKVESIIDRKSVV